MEEMKMKIDFTEDSGERIRFNDINEYEHCVVYDGVLFLIQNRTFEGTPTPYLSWANIEDLCVFGYYNSVKEAIEDLKSRGDCEDDLFEVHDIDGIELKPIFNF